MSLGRGDANTANARKTLPNRIIVTGPAHAETLAIMDARAGKPFKQRAQDMVLIAGHAPRESVTTLPPFDSWQPKRRKKRKKPMPEYPRHRWSE